MVLQSVCECGSWDPPEAHHSSGCISVVVTKKYKIIK